MIEEFEQDEVCKYLVIDESNEIQHAVIKRKKKRKDWKSVTGEYTSNPKDRTQLCKTHRGNTCCNV